MNGQKVMRLFIFDNPEEIEDQSKILNMQLGLGTEVRFLIKSSFINQQKFKERIKKLETIDFGIVDDNWVFRLFLDTKRRIRRINAVNDEDMLRVAKYLMDEMIKESEIYEKR